MKTQATPYQTVTANLGRLNRRQLEDVAAQVAALLAVLEDEADDEATALTSSNTGPGLKKGGQAGYVEHKTINGCGPYAYLRFWSGKTHRSTYLGKVEAKQ